MKQTRLLSTLALLLLPATMALAQTGKIAGVVVEAERGTPLPGANVAIEGSRQGAVTDSDGYYAILNVRPGTHTLRASFIGYTPVVYRQVEVFVGLTTDRPFELSEEVIEGGALVVTASRPVVQRDVSASIANINAEEIENLPFTDVERVVGLQAGFERDLTIRGFGGDQVQFRVDGLSTASGFRNEPYAGVSYTAVQEMQVQTGGFNAEYGNVRAGLINVITKDPDGHRYTVDAIARYGPVSPSAFAGTDVDGRRVARPDSRWTFQLRPLFDPEVAMDGVTAWPTWKRGEYRSWSGWNALAASYNRDHGTRFTGADLQHVFAQHYLRKDMEVTTPDYEIDATVGGPVPGLSSLPGGLRFLASYRQAQQAYPLAGNARDAFTERLAQGKLLSTFRPGMQLVLQALYAGEDGLTRSETGERHLLTGDEIHYPWKRSARSMYATIGQYPGDPGFNLGELFTNLTFHLMDVDRLVLGARFTHALDAKTFYEVKLQRTRTDYFTRTIGPRNGDPTFSYLDGQVMLDAAPFGQTSGLGLDVLGVGMHTSGFWGLYHDHSSIRHFTGRFDLTSQVNRFSLLKTGVEYIYSNYEVDYGKRLVAVNDKVAFRWKWRRRPQQAAAYAQTKLEFKGLIANVGVRLDYFHAGGDWYVYGDFDRAFSVRAGIDRIDETLEQAPIEPQAALSPRLGISFPVTDNSKLYFNYGHFRSRLDPIALFALIEGREGVVAGIGNPNHPMPKTVAYELGFEQNLFDRYHLRLAGYYRDLSQDPRDVRFIGVDDLVEYTSSQPWAYADVRGFEATLTKRSGPWVRGFINYTYMARKTGHFGFSRFDENRLAMIEHVTTTTEHYASKPIPEPYARANLTVLLPIDLGPRLGNAYPLGDWRISFLGEWRRGQTLTWNGLSLGDATGGANNRQVQGNVRWRDYYMLDVRLSKNFDTNFGSAQFFVDVRNVLDLRHLYLSGGSIFADGTRDDQKYMQSLHLPRDVLPEGHGGDYPRIYGDDQPGDFRKPGAEYVPIIVGSLPGEGDGTRPLYYVPDDDAYYQWNGNAFVDADGEYVDLVLHDKAYINMPNRTWGTFLNPRSVFFGLRLSF